MNAPHHMARRLRRPVLTALAGLGLALGAGSASAADLILLNGDPAVQLQGTVNYGIVYVDGTVQLVGDTTINANFVYFGPASQLQTCVVPGVGNDNCQNGRNFTINSAGPIAFNQGIDLTGATGATQAGGSLNLTGSSIVVGGSITTVGTSAGSGNVVLSATGSIETQGITATGALIKLGGGGGVTANGNVTTRTPGSTVPSGIAGKAASGGPIEITSTAGDVTVLGDVTSDGFDAPAGGLSGGNGGAVTISGSDVRTNQINTTGGSSVDSTGGIAGPVTLTARGSLQTLGTVDVSGSGSTNNAGSAGGSVTATAAGQVVMTGISAFGANAPLGGGGSPGGSIAVTAGAAALGNLNATGGNALNSATPGNGGAGGTIRVSAAGNVSLGGTTQASGGQGAPAGGGSLGGPGGTIEIVATNLTTGQVLARGGTNSGGAGVAGGSIRLNANGNLTTSGLVSTIGSSASGDNDPPRAGGNGGPILLRAAAGTLNLGGRVESDGANGAGHPVDGQRGGAGGDGGSIDIVSAAVGSVSAISANGGDGGDFGDDQGPGGKGGTLRHWGDGSLFDDTKVVEALGGSGNPVGSDGQRIAQTAPSGLTVSTTGVLAFTANSPQAQGYRVLRSVAGGPLEVLATTTSTTGIQASGPPCVPMTFTVVAYHDGLGWQSAGAPAVQWTAPPSASQACNQAPAVQLALVKKGTITFKAKALRKAKWKAKLRLTANGMGVADVSIAALVKVKGKKKPQPKKPFARLNSAFAAAGQATVTIPLPKVAPATYQVTLVVIAPDGVTKTTQKLTLEVKP